MGHNRPATGTGQRARTSEEPPSVSGLKKTTEKNLMVFSGRAHPELAEEVARHAVSLVGSRRVVLSVPAWRGGVTRAAGVAPSLSRHAMRMVEAQGRRAIARRATDRAGG